MARSPVKGDARLAAERIARGIELYADGQHDAALHAFEEALVASPEHPEALANRRWLRRMTEGAQASEWTPSPLTPTAVVGGLGPAAPASPPDGDETSFADNMEDAATASRPVAGTLLGLAAVVLPTQGAPTPPAQPEPPPPLEPLPPLDLPASEDGELRLESPGLDLPGEPGLDDGSASPTNPFIRPELLAASLGAPGPGPTAVPVRPVEPLPPVKPVEPLLPVKPVEPPPPAQPSGAVDARRETMMLFAPDASSDSPEALLVAAMSQARLGDANAALGACERAIDLLGGLEGTQAAPHRAAIEDVYAAIVGRPEQRLELGRATPNLDPKTAFLLSRLDGTLTVEDVVDISGMPRLETLRALAVLVSRGAIVPR